LGINRNCCDNPHQVFLISINKNNQVKNRSKITSLILFTSKTYLRMIHGNTAFPLLTGKFFRATWGRIVCPKAKFWHLHGRFLYTLDTFQSSNKQHQRTEDPQSTWNVKFKKNIRQSVNCTTRLPEKETEVRFVFYDTCYFFGIICV